MHGKPLGAPRDGLMPAPAYPSKRRRPTAYGFATPVPRLVRVGWLGEHRARRTAGAPIGLHRLYNGDGCGGCKLWQAYT